MATRLGLTRWQLTIAIQQGLLPGPDRTGGRWSARLVAECLPRVEGIKAALGEEAPIGASRAAVRLSARIALDVEKADIESLVVSGDLPIAGTYRAYPLYSPRDLDALDPDAVTDVVRSRKGRLFDTVDTRGAAALLGWHRDTFGRIAAENAIPTDELGRHPLAAVRALADNPELQQAARLSERAHAYQTAKATAATAEQTITTWLHHCTDYLAHRTPNPPSTPQLTRALRTLTTTRTQLKALE